MRKLEEKNRANLYQCGQYWPQIRQIRTDISVRKVNQVLQGLKNRKVINNFGDTKPFSTDDLYGIDFIIYKPNGKKISIQLKTRFFPGEKKIYEQKDIYCLEVPYEKGEREVEEDILKILAKEERKIAICASITDPRAKRILERSLL